MYSFQALNPLGKCEWLLYHYSPAKGEKLFIPPYLNCEVNTRITNFFRNKNYKEIQYRLFHLLTEWVTVASKLASVLSDLIILIAVD